MKRLLIWLAVILGLGAMIWGLALLGAAQPTVSEGTLDADPVTSSDWQRGGLMAQTTLVEYSDFECPACASYFPVLESLKQTYGSQVRFVYRAYPLPMHRHADLAARVAEAAGNQNKFWEMHDLLFTNQSKWSGSSNPLPLFNGYAASLGLNAEQFAKDINSSETKKKVADDIASGNRANVDGTPTFFLNGKKLTNLQSYGDLEQAIKDALQGK